jgi:hypothetical protein
VASLLADAAAGFTAMPAAMAVCFFIPGSFMAWEPWVFAMAALLFVAGYLRGGGPPRNRWAKAIRIDLGAGAFVAFWLHGANGWPFLSLALLATLLPTALGVYFRRRRIRL